MLKIERYRVHRTAEIFEPCHKFTHKPYDIERLRHDSVIGRVGLPMSKL